MLPDNYKIQNIKDKIKKASNGNERLRLNVVYLHYKLHSLSEIADLLCLSYHTAQNYLEEYLNDNKSDNSPRGGSDEKLNDKQSKELESHLQNKTYLKCHEIINYIQITYNISYTKSGLKKWLKRHKFTYKKPVKYPAKLDPVKQKNFINYYRELKANLAQDEEILFFDSVHPEHQSQAVFGWIKKGSKLAIPTTAKQFRAHYIGSVNINNPEKETITKRYDTVNSEAIINFFEHLNKIYTHKTKLHIILDNASYHKSKNVKAYLANSNSKIQLHYLPSYSPNLNAIERLWKIAREHVTYNRYYPTFNEFKEKIDDFFTEKIPQIGDILRRRINDNFQIIEPVFLQV